MTQSIIIQVGQCGNQIGCRFWDLALRECMHFKKGGVYDESANSFFRRADSRPNTDLKNSQEQLLGSSLKARAILLDMEDGVVNQLLTGPLRDVFDCKQLLTSHSGSGNNWAVGHKFYGNHYRETILDLVRRGCESCDCLQTFFIIHSAGGGTGSGLGTALLEMLEDEYPEIYRFAISVYPSEDDDVITSPYNTVLATRFLTNYADCVLPIENERLLDICNSISMARSISKNIPAKAIEKSSCITSSKSCIYKGSKPFDEMNNIVANLILNLTSSSRFDGTMNVDLNEITTNLVPYSRLHYMISSITPLYSMMDVNVPVRRIDEMFTEAFSSKCQLVRASPSGDNVYLACALLSRGNIYMSDIRRNIERLRPKLNFVHWNSDGWKTGLCTLPPIGLQHSLLTLSNNTCMQNMFTNLLERFGRLYHRKAHLHHYLQVENMEVEDFEQSFQSIDSVIKEYKELEQNINPVLFPMKVKV